MLCHFHDMILLRGWIGVIAFYRKFPEMARRGAEHVCLVFAPSSDNLLSLFSFTNSVHCSFAEIEAKMSCAMYLLAFLTQWEFRGTS